MTLIYNDKNAYDAISRDIEINFHTYINKDINDIKNITIVGGFYCEEAVKFLQRYPNAVIHIFEPVPEHFSRLKSIYQDINRCKLYNIAITNKIGIIDFYKTSNPGSDSIYPVLENNKSGYSFKTTEKIQVNSDRLINVVQDYIDLLSIDVQGGELEVLKGTNLNNVSSIFAEIQMAENKENAVYDGQCFSDDLQSYLGDKFELHSLGLDNELNNGTGNSFWITK
jgi:FkbM family methyltransferase